MVCRWHDGARVVQAARRARGVPATPLVLELLDRITDWTPVDALAVALALPVTALTVLLDGLAALELVEQLDARPSDHGPTGGTLASASPWDTWVPAARWFHEATRDVPFGASGGRDGPAGEVGATVAAARPPVVLPPQGRETIPLPFPVVSGPFRRALQQRRTHRRFASGALSAQHLGTLLGVTFGVQAWAHTPEGPLALKTSPSGGARHSLEAWVWVRRVEALDPGLYHYRSDVHGLTRLDDRPAPDRVTAWLPAQDGYEGAPVVVAVASVLARVAWRYRSARAYRVVLIEAGHLAQTFCLTASALGLAPFCTAALADSVIESHLGLDGQVSPVVYAMGAGRPAPGAWRPHEQRPAPRLEVTALGEALDTPDRRAVSRRSSRPSHPPRRERGR